MVDRFLNILALVTLVEMMLYVGLGASVADFVAAARDGKLVAKALLANYLLAPAATLGLLILFGAEPMVAVGFLLLAVAPGGPYGPPFTALAKGNAGTAAGLMVILAGTSPLLTPLLLNLMVPIVACQQQIRVDAVRIAVTLLVGQVLPLLVGLAVNHWRPRAAARIVGPAGQICKILNVVFLGTILFVQFRSLLAIHATGFLGMALLLAAFTLIGWVAGGPRRDGRIAMALTTAVRNNGVGMVIAVGSFAGTPAVTATVVFGAVSILGAALLALWLGKRNARTTPAALTPPPVP